MYQGIFDTDFDKYTEDAIALFTSSGVNTVFENLEDFPMDWKTNPAAFIKFVRDHQCNSFLEYGEYPFVSATEIKSALKVKAGMTEVRRVGWPNFEGEEYSERMFLQGIAGTLELFHLSIVSFQNVSSSVTSQPVSVYQRIDRAGQKLPLDERVLDDTDTLLVFGLDHMVTEQTSRTPIFSSRMHFIPDNMGSLTCATTQRKIFWSELNINTAAGITLATVTTRPVIRYRCPLRLISHHF
jgi:hypothetical protein